MSRAAKREDKRKRWDEKILKTKVRDYSKMKRVRIDSRTEILISPKADPEKEKQRFLDAHARRAGSTFHKMVS